MKHYSDQYLKMMDVSLNLSRIGNWTADSYAQKKDLINHFIDQTKLYMNELYAMDMTKDLKKVIKYIYREFNTLVATQDSIPNDRWAEHALTLANILQHRAKLA